MSANQYEHDNPVKVSALFKVGSTPTDPTTVKLEVKSPVGTKSTYNYPADITKDGTGAYSKVLTPNLPGNWYYHWTGTGTCTAASEKYFILLPTEF